jgi:hypothetical protein
MSSPTEHPICCKPQSPAKWPVRTSTGGRYRHASDPFSECISSTLGHSCVFAPGTRRSLRLLDTAPDVARSSDRHLALVSSSQTLSEFTAHSCLVFTWQRGHERTE